MDFTSMGMRLAGWAAAVIITGVGTAAFILSFSALRGLAEMAHIPRGALSGLLPIVVDGTIVQATLGWLVLAGRPERRWFLVVLVAGSAVSIAGNSLHAAMAGRALPWWACAMVAAVAPVSLLADTHGLAVLFRAAQLDTAPAHATGAVVESTAAEPEPVTADPLPVASTPDPVSVSRVSRRADQVQPLLPVALPVGGA